MQLPGGGQPGTCGQMGRYQLIASLGHGGMADVYLAVASGPAGFNKLQVIKCLRPNLAEEEEFLAMFLDEARLAARLNHQNVVQTNEVGDAAGRYFIIMEYLDGQPLNRILRRARRVLEAGLSLEARLTIVAEALAGLHYAHELTDYDGSALCVVHRDASPHNIFVTYDGYVKLVDFGIAKAERRTAETKTGTLKGKISYMAPEQARCEEVTRRADVFTLGVVLWEAVVGRSIWHDASDIAVLDGLARREPLPTIRSVRPDAPPEVDAICSIAMSMEPEHRYPTAEEMRRNIMAYLHSGGRRPASHDEIGRIVAQLFSEDRAKLKELVADQLSALSNVPAGGQVEILDLAPLAATGTARAASASHVTAVGGRAAVDEQGTNPTLARAATAGSLGPGAPPGHGRTALLLGAGTVVLGGLFAGVALWGPWLGRSAEPPAAQAPAMSSPQPSPQSSAVESGFAAAQGQSITIEISVTPKQASIYLDDRKLAANPYTGEHVVDGEDHELRIEAPGYEPDRQTLRFDRSMTIGVELTKSTSGRLPVAAGARPRPSPRDAKGASTSSPAEDPAAAPEPGDVAGRPGQPKNRELDSSDPWAD